MHERLFVSAGVRGDRSSNNGDVDKYFFYPKAAASYRLPGGAGPFGDVKFRLAWGQSGNQPLYGMKFLAVDATQNIGGIPGLVAPGTVGDPTIKPERQTEIEGGVDATLASGRATFEVTADRKSTRLNSSHGYISYAVFCLKKKKKTKTTTTESAS